MKGSTHVIHTHKKSLWTAFSFKNSDLINSSQWKIILHKMVVFLKLLMLLILHYNILIFFFFNPWLSVLGLSYNACLIKPIRGINEFKLHAFCKTNFKASISVRTNSIKKTNSDIIIPLLFCSYQNVNIFSNLITFILPEWRISCIFSNVQLYHVLLL